MGMLPITSPWIPAAMDADDAAADDLNRSWKAALFEFNFDLRARTESVLPLLQSLRSFAGNMIQLQGLHQDTRA